MDAGASLYTNGSLIDSVNSPSANYRSSANRQTFWILVLSGAWCSLAEGGMRGSC
jgi:hypothetical protein